MEQRQGVTSEPTKLERFCVCAIRWLAGALLLWLLLLSATNTIYLLDRWEHCYFLGDKWYLHAIVALAAIACAAISYRYRRSLLAWVRRVRPHRVILALYALLLTCFVLMTQSMQWSDSLNVMRTAAQMRNGDFSAFESGGYMDVFTNQKGIVLFFYALSLLFGGGNYVAVEMLNAAAALVSCWALYRITLRISHSELLATVVLAAACLFAPLVFYTAFTYGTLLGLALALLAFERLLAFCECGRLRVAVCASLLMALACMLKSNYLVMLIAMGIVLLVELVRRRSVKGLAAVLSVVLALAAVTVGTDAALRWATGGKSAQLRGVPYTFWVETGLQDSSCAPGWFEQSTLDTYVQGDLSAEQVKAMSQENVRERLRFFWQNPEQARSFFVRKTCSQWCEPTFQGLWLVQIRESGVAEPSELVEMLQSPFSKMSQLLKTWMNYAQTFTYFGALLFVFLSGRRMRLPQLVGLIALLGGFLFHLVCEGKAQYAMPYFVLLLPYAVLGMASCAKRVAEVAEAIRNREKLSALRPRLPALLAVAALVAALFVPSLSNRWIRCENPQDVQAYAQAQSTGLPSGEGE